VTRAISVTPAAGSDMKCTTSCARLASNVASANGSDSAAACRMSTSGCLARAASTNDGEGSIAVTFGAETRATSSVVSAPGPQPTSITRCPPATPAKSASCGDSCIE